MVSQMRTKKVDEAKITSRMSVELRTSLIEEAKAANMTLNELVVTKLKKPLVDPEEQPEGNINEALAKLQVQVGSILLAMEEMNWAKAKVTSETILTDRQDSLEVKELVETLSSDLFKNRYALKLLDERGCTTKAWNDAIQAAKEYGWVAPDGLLWKSEGQGKGRLWHCYK